MTIKEYKCGVKGESLYQAIVDSGSGSYDPPIMTKWVDGMIEGYMEEDWDGERIYHLLWGCRSSKLIKAFEKEGIDVEDTGYSRVDGMTRKDLKKLCKKYKFEKFYEDFKQDMDAERFNWAHELAWDDHNRSLDDINKESDSEVAEFYGISAEIIGVNTEFRGWCGVDDCYVCPYCEAWSPMEQQEELREEWHEDWPEDKVGTNHFICFSCNGDWEIKEPDFIKANKHLPQEVIISKVV